MDVNDLLTVANKYVDDHLVELCYEQLQLQTGQMNSGDLPHVTKLRELCAYAGHSAIRMAEGLIAQAAMSRVAIGSQADIDRESYK